MKKRLSLLCLVFIIISSNCYGVAAESEFATRGKVLEMILTAADAYNEEIEASDIMKGDGDGNLRKNDPVRRVEAMAMLSRAFPNLPAPTEYQLTIGNFGNEFTDLPDWAVSDLANLRQAGIIAGYPDGRLGVDDNVTEEQMELLIRRIWAYLGSNLKDNFYMTQNKQWLDTTTLSAADLSVGTFYDVSQVTSQQLETVIMEMVEGDWKEDTKEQRVKDFYTAAADVNARNGQGIKPIQVPLQRIDEAKSLSELLYVHAYICEATGNINILGMFSDVDIKSGASYVAYVSGMSGILEKAYFETEDPTAKEAYLNLVSDTLELGGESAKDADAHAAMMYEMEREIALASLDLKDYYDFEKTYARYEFREFANLLDGNVPWFLITPWDKGGFFVLTDEGRVLKTIEFLKEENLETIKSYLKFWLLQDSASLLSQDMQQPYIDFVKAMYDVEIPLDPKGNAVSLVQTYLPECLEEDYAKRFCSPEIKEKATALVNQLKDDFKIRLERADWLSVTTRNNAIEKLDHMIVNVAYPKEFYDIFEGVTFDGDLFANATVIKSFYAYVSQEMIGEKTDHTLWPMYCYTVNAAYMPNYNSITIPAGILQAPFYDEDAKEEENLAGIGVVIGHEITHAFDSSGADYDKNGAYHSWWTEQDRTVFEEKCKKVELLYDGVEISNHAKCDGELTLSENIADLGGMASALDVMKTLDAPDYQLFFTHYATVWRQYSRQNYVNYLAENDVHSPEFLRVNHVVKNFGEFYDAFDIQPGDGMYLPPEERITIW
ncbi:MAG: hypothetical protein E7399_00170 [Ruminococcaceae bacterium]|nr:hypothetical protein [Oscillospiraceae bacterium]